MPLIAQPSRAAPGPDAAFDNASSLNLQNMGLVSLDGMPTMASLEALNVSENRLTNFYGIPTHPSLRLLDASNNRVTSLLGMSHQPSLEVVNMEGNPICAHPEFRLMVLLACGETVALINRRMVTDDERRAAQFLGGSGGWAARCVSFGWTDLTTDDRSEAEYQQLVDDLKVHYVSMVRSLDKNYSFASVMARRGPDFTSANGVSSGGGGSAVAAALQFGASPPPYGGGGGASAQRRSMSPRYDEDADHDGHHDYGGGDYQPQQQQYYNAAGSSSDVAPRLSSSTAPPSPLQPYGPGLRGGHPVHLTPSQHQQQQQQQQQQQYDNNTANNNKAQLTLSDLHSFYQQTGVPRMVHPQGSTPNQRAAAAASPYQARQQHLAQQQMPPSTSAPAAQQRPLGVDLHRAPAPIPTHYSAVDAARRYALHFKKTGSVVGADVLDVFPDAASGAGARTVHTRPPAEQQLQLQRPASSPSAAALVLMQQEVGCLSGLDLDNLDVTISDNGTTYVRNALCRVVGGATLHILESSHVVYSLDLPSAQDISFEKHSGSVRVVAGVPSGAAMAEVDAPEVVLTVQETAGTKQVREALARGVFKLLMLFKCTPEELEAFYAATLIRH